MENDTDSGTDSNLYTLDTFRRVEPREEVPNGVFTWEGISYLVEVTGPSQKKGEIEVLVIGFMKDLEPARLSPKKLALIPLDSPSTIRDRDLKPVTRPFVVLNLPQFAAHNAMLFTKLGNLVEAER